MHCLQCEQTARGTCCTVSGVCGKKPEVAALQDLLIYGLRALAHYARAGREAGLVDEAVNRFTVAALFATLTNVNFDPGRFQELIYRCAGLVSGLKQKMEAAGIVVQADDPALFFQPADSLESLIEQGEAVGLALNPEADEDIRSLQQTVLFGLKGVAAYMHHASVLGREDDAVYAFIHETLSSLYDCSPGYEGWIKMALRCGEINLRAMELLDAANTGRYGHPVPTRVPLGHRKGKCILVSGHDLKDLEELLVQTEGLGITVYTHGEMLPAHGYPGLKKYKHLYGHFGTAWQNQKKEFPQFPGAILMTTNCIQEPQQSYLDNIFTTGTVGWPGARHVENGKFAPVIEKALAMDGFSDDEDKGSVNVGFARNTIMGVAGKVIEGIKNGAINHIFLVGGCDGARSSRSYYADFVDAAPADSLVLTLACGKFRFFDHDLGEIDGIPRLLDVGQCNDAYSAIQVAVALAEALQCSVNDLPLSLILSWYEQKAVAILLTLLHLGIKNIRLGPSLPAFISPRVLETLVDAFAIKPISTPEEDLKAILG